MYGFISLGFNLKHTNIPFVNMFPRTYIHAFYVFFFTIYENNAFHLWKWNIGDKYKITKCKFQVFSPDHISNYHVQLNFQINTLYFYFQDTNSFFLTKNLRAQGIKVRVAQWGGEGEQEKYRCARWTVK